MSNSNEDNHNIRWAIQTIAQKGMVNPFTGNLNGVGYIVGYVIAVNDDNTIDVAEFGYSKDDWEFDGEHYSGPGVHSNVRITPMEDNNEGYKLVPKIHSEVAITRGEDKSDEYVALFSHLDKIQLDSHESLNIRVREREEYKPDDPNADDIDELKLTGIYAATDYSKNSISSGVKWEDKEESIAKQIIGVDKDSNKQGVFQSAGDKTNISLTTDEAEITHDKSILKLDKNKSSLEHEGSSITIKNKKVYVGSEDNVSNAVLGQELAGFLSELIDCLCQTLTPTLMGTMPSTNIPQLTTLAAKVKSFQAGLGGNSFISKNVNIQK